MPTPKKEKRWTARPSTRWRATSSAQKPIPEPEIKITFPDGTTYKSKIRPSAIAKAYSPRSFEVQLNELPGKELVDRFFVHADQIRQYEAELLLNRQKIQNLLFNKYLVHYQNDLENKDTTKEFLINALSKHDNGVLESLVNLSESDPEVLKSFAEVAKLGDEGLSSVFRAIQNAIEKANPQKRTEIPDPVAEEIAREVTLRWGQRLKLHPDAEWTANPSTYVRHVFGKWYEAGTLRLRHLKIDPTLYTKYIAYVGAHAKDDLGLPRDQRGRKLDLTAEEREARQREQKRRSLVRYKARTRKYP